MVQQTWSPQPILCKWLLNESMRYATRVTALVVQPDNVDENCNKVIPIPCPHHKTTNPTINHWVMVVENDVPSSTASQTMQEGVIPNMTYQIRLLSCITWKNWFWLFSSIFSCHEDTLESSLYLLQVQPFKRRAVRKYHWENTGSGL